MGSRVSGREDGGFKILLSNASYGNIGTTSPILRVVPETLSFTIKSFIVQGYKNPSGGMEQTLLIGDHFLIEKHSYRFGNPGRGDVIVFDYPLEPDKVFIKRVIGVEGDMVKMANKKLYINGEEANDPHAFYKEEALLRGDSQRLDNFGPVTVPPGKLFVLGDNRNQSLDSRFFGFVPLEKVKGKAFIIHWSWDRQKTAIRWERVGQTIK
jgi:signal peptidase I